METALITGASSGIGLELARKFASQGINLIVVARGIDKLNQLKAELESAYKIQVKTIELDLSLLNSAEILFDQVKDLNIKYLVNNAGYGDFCDFDKCDIKKNESIMILNVITLTKLTRLLTPILEAANGARILNLASTAAFQGTPKFAIYSATKAFVLNFSVALAVELEGKNITVTALCPGPTSTGFQAKSAMPNSSFATGAYASSKSVAEFGYKAMMRGQKIAVHGFKNSLFAFGTRLIPRTLASRIAGRVMEMV